jgi:AcrR family transcriptional regulator
MARPRSAKAHNKVLDAAAQLFAERGIDGTSMDAIAETSGVSKATIYKHWPDKDTLCLEVLSYLHGLDDERPTFDSGDYLADLVAELKYEPALDRKALRERIVPHMMAYSWRNPAFGREWRSRALEPRRKAIAAIVKRGESRGILQRDIDPEIALSLLLGPLMYRFLLINKVGAAGPQNLEEHVARAFLAAFGLDHPQANGVVARKRTTGD